MSVNIMIVDDSLPMRTVIIKTIKASGFANARFFEAVNGREALNMLQTQWMDLIITDYNMPEMNGMELLQEMKKDDILRAIPVLVVTTEGSREKVKAFLAQGAADYVKKPFTPEEIRGKIISLLGVEDLAGGAGDVPAGMDF
ncbi:MAG TPA: response regulator [Desulfobacterales bacterium]|jgi:two-component system, chemotaxis family, chemotaxis protein CheY|nr:response regulator [Desulfobacterales bacterium]